MLLFNHLSAATTRYYIPPRHVSLLIFNRLSANNNQLTDYLWSEIMHLFLVAVTFYHMKIKAVVWCPCEKEFNFLSNGGKQTKGVKFSSKQPFEN